MRTISIDDLTRSRVAEMSQLVSARVEGADLRGLSIRSLRLLHCTFDNCRFDGSNLEDLRVWDTTFSGCSFRSAQLRGFAFGGQLDGRFNFFSDCDFTRTDLRRSATGPARMVRCRFVEANLNKVEFQGTRLEDTIFAGNLVEVGFYARAFTFPDEPANTMHRVDFGQAQLHFCDFRKLDLDTILLPAETSHVIVRNLPKFLDDAEHRYTEVVPARGFVAVLEHIRKWRGEHQLVAIFGVKELSEMLPEGEIARVRQLGAG